MAQADSSGGAAAPGSGPALAPLLEGSLGLGAGLILLALILITCIDVVGRYVLDAPLSGAFEMTEILLAALVFLALPLTTERREHVEVDLLGMMLPARANRLLSIFAGVFSAAALATFAWRLALHAAGAAADGAVSNALSIPLAPVGYLASLSCLLSAVIALQRGFRAPAGESEGA